MDILPSGGTTTPGGEAQCSRQDRLDHVAVHVGQAVVAALELERQPGVVDAQAVQDRGVQVVDVDGVLRRCCSRSRRSRRG